MNTNSYLCRYISSHPDWKNELVEQYHLKIKMQGNYAIFNYDHDSDFSNPIVQEARGIILDITKQEVVCWPFRKFGNYYESYADKIDWATARVQEKVDGSIVKLWYDFEANAWTFSTNRMLDASETKIGENAQPDFRANSKLNSQLSANQSFKSNFLSLIHSAVNYKDICFESLNKDYTYIFEMVSPQTQIVIRYQQTLLIHIGTRNRITGQELDEDIHIKKPASYPLHSLKDCIQAAEKLNAQSADEASVEKEGFVVVDANWNRVKIKSPEYLVAHRIIANGTCSKKHVLELLWDEKKEVSYLCSLCPADARIFFYYAYQLEEFAWKCDTMAEFDRGVCAEAEGDRKAVAKVIGKMPLAAVGFWALEHEEPGRKWMEQLRLSVLMKSIPEYYDSSIFS